jgi:hypothetical protein
MEENFPMWTYVVRRKATPEATTAVGRVSAEVTSGHRSHGTRCVSSGSPKVTGRESGRSAKTGEEDPDLSRRRLE